MEFVVHHNIEGLVRLWKDEFIDGVPPVDASKFLEDPYFLGEFGKSLYPVWKKDLLYVLNPINNIEEWALVGAQGSGKSTAALVGQTYKLYWLSRLKNPQKYFFLDPTTNIYFGFFTLNREKAEDILYSKFHAILEQSSYFKDRFPMRKRRVGGIKVSKNIQDQTTEGSDWNYELLFPKGVHIVSGSQTSHALSIDLMSVVLDEMNWRRKKTLRPEEDINSALTLYEQVRTRISSRFMTQGVKPGLLTVISSKRATTDFMDSLVARMKKEPYRCYISDYALWEAKPDRIYSGKKFYVFVGGSQTKSHIIDDTHLHEYDVSLKNVYAIPVEYRAEFDMSLTTALHDIAGISTVPHELLFDKEEHLTQCIDLTRTSPFTQDVIELGLSSPYSLNKFFKQAEFTHHDGFKLKPKYWPESERYIHIDLSKTKNATGITMLCPYKVGRMVIPVPGGSPVVTLVPLVWIDLMMRLVAPKEDQIDYDKIREFVQYLRNCGFRIVNVSYDTYQCLAAGTLVNTSRGLIPIEKAKIGDLVASRIGPRPVQKTWSFGEHSTIKITMKDGDTLEGTEKHCIEVRTAWAQGKDRRVVSKWKWKRLDEIKLGDVVHLVEEAVPLNTRKNTILCGSKLNFGWRRGAGRKSKADTWEFPKRMTPELAEVLGLLWGDGNISEDSLRLTVTPNEAPNARRVFRALFGFSPKYRARKSTHGVISVSGRWITRWMKKNGLLKPLIPEAILTSSREVQAAFIQGLFATDGSVNKNTGQVSFSTKHLKLAEQVMILLRTEFGLACHLTKIQRGHKGDYLQEGIQYVVLVRGSRNAFISQIGFSYTKKTRDLALHNNRPGRRIFSRIAKIESSRARVFDLQVEGDPSYTANGFVSHNSADSIQLLSKMGFNTSNISVEADLPYLNLRTAFAQKRINWYRYDPAIEELKALIHDLEKDNVDHPDMDPFGGPGRKDIADSICGAYTALARAIATKKVSTASPTAINLGQIRPKEPAVVDASVVEFFRGVIPVVPDSVTGHRTDRFITEDYQEYPKNATIEEVLKEEKEDEKKEILKPG